MARAAKTEVVHLDTHVVCWLYEGRADLLSMAARETVERANLVTTPIVVSSFSCYTRLDES